MTCRQCAWCRAVGAVGAAAVVVLLAAGAARADSAGDEDAFATAREAVQRLDAMRFYAAVEVGEVERLVGRALAAIEEDEAALAERMRRLEAERAEASARERQALRDERRAARLLEGRLWFLKGELHRRAAGLLDEGTPGRQAHIGTAVTIFQDLRVSHRDLSVGAFGYLGEARVRRLTGERERAEAVLQPLLERRSGDERPGEQSMRLLAELELLEWQLDEAPAEAARVAERLLRQAEAGDNGELAGRIRWARVRALAEDAEQLDAAVELLRDESTVAATHEHERLALLDRLERRHGRALMTTMARLQWARVSAAAGYAERALAILEEVHAAAPSAFTAADWLAYGGLLFERGAYAAAARAYAEALGDDAIVFPQREAVLRWRAAALRRVHRDGGDDEAAADLAAALQAVVESAADATVRAGALRERVELNADGRSTAELADGIADHPDLLAASAALGYTRQALRWRGWRERRAGGAADADVAEVRDIVQALEEVAALADENGEAPVAARAALLEAMIYLDSPLRDAAAAEAALRGRWADLQRESELAAAAVQQRVGALLAVGRIDEAIEVAESVGDEAPLGAATSLALARALAERHRTGSSQRAEVQQRVRALVSRALDVGPPSHARVAEAADLLIDVQAARFSSLL